MLHKMMISQCRRFSDMLSRNNYELHPKDNDNYALKKHFKFFSFKTVALYFVYKRKVHPQSTYFIQLPY